MEEDRTVNIYVFGRVGGLLNEMQMHDLVTPTSIINEISINRIYVLSIILTYFKLYELILDMTIMKCKLLPWKHFSSLNFKFWSRQTSKFA